MMDEHSLLVTYRFDRGEPRGAHKKGEPWDGRGDCVDCKQCVAACPMGVDIREGLQLPCIQCALCIDACNDVMDKIGRPRGLIAYDTDLNIARRQHGEAPSYRPVRPRTIAYAVLLTAVGSIMLYALAARRSFDIDVLHDRNPLYVRLSNGDIRNAFTVNVINKDRLGRSIVLRVEGVDGAVVSGVGVTEVGDGSVRVAVDGDNLQAARIFVTAPRTSITGESKPLRFVATAPSDGEPITVDTVFLAPHS
jgi:cytochrome c oxidase accessory protein FixG